MDLSIVIPVYNSEKILSKLIEEIEIYTSSNGIKKEIILVNDFSNDKSWDKILEIIKNNKNIKGINLQNNYGHTMLL